METNPNVPYRRSIIKATWVPPSRLPIVFHTSNTESINEVNPAFCQSFDYSFMGGVIPVTYVLPFPHVNRAKGSSDILGRTRQEALEKSGLPYTYLMVQKDDKDFGRIRMNSTMLDQYLLACVNSGFVFKLKIAELKNNKPKAFFNEYISLLGLPVIDAYKFRSPSPIGLGASKGKSLETHLPLDIARPELVGYQTLEHYLASIKDPYHKSQIVDVANVLVTQHPKNAMHGIFEQLVEMNTQAIKNVSINDGRLLVSIKPIHKNA